MRLPAPALAALAALLPALAVACSVARRPIAVLPPVPVSPRGPPAGVDVALAAEGASGDWDAEIFVDGVAQKTLRDSERSGQLLVAFGTHELRVRVTTFVMQTVMTTQTVMVPRTQTVPCAGSATTTCTQTVMVPQTQSVPTLVRTPAEHCEAQAPLDVVFEEQRRFTIDADVKACAVREVKRPVW